MMKTERGLSDKIKRFVINKNYRILCLCNLGVFNWMDDEKYLKMRYKATIGEDLNLNHPQTFNEKLQWLKLHDRNPEYIKMVDKYEVKKYVSDKIGEQYIIPTYGVWDSFDEIDFDSFPNQFVLKCTHDSGGIIICSDKKTFNLNRAKRKLNNYLKRNYYWIGREWPYKYVQPRIIAEKYMSEGNNKIDNNLKDYKMYCFNGVPNFTLVCSDRFSQDGRKETFYDNNWIKLPIKRALHDIDTKGVEKPKNFDLMKKFAHILSKNIPYARVDFFEICGNLYFSEITFYPSGGFEGFEPKGCDYKLGDILKLHT